jgi:hypothetical protein
MTTMPPAERFAALAERFTSPVRSSGVEALLDACKAACVAFTAALCVGATLVMAAKLAHPALAAGASPVSVLTAVVIVALGVLGIPIRVGGVEVTAVPLGGLLAVGAVVAWAAARIVAARGIAGERAGALAGARVCVPFALLVWISALVFRLRSPATPVAAGGAEALVLAGLHACVFGALGGWWAQAPLGRVGELLEGVRARSAAGFEGLAAGVVMLVVAAAGALAAVAIWGVLSLVGEGTRSPASLLAAVLFVIAFLPNLVVTLLALAVGAPVEVGAQVRLLGRDLGPLREFSLGDWGGGTPPAAIWLLVLIPLGACLVGGFAARRHSAVPRRAPEILAVAALTFAVPLGTLAVLSRARLGAGLVSASGFAYVAPDGLAVFLWSLAWAGVMGAAGWRVGERQAPVRPPAVSRQAGPEDTSIGRQIGAQTQEAARETGGRRRLPGRQGM